MDEDFFKIQLKLVDKHFPYTCKRSEEANLRKAATNLTDKYMEYSSYYSQADFEQKDLLKLVGFHFSLELLEDNQKEDMSPLVNKIEQLNKELEIYLQSF
ncbi:MAG: cell division protein ZapA [Candidatus Symbiothrix sp.]|jgi:cell division protein ZapA|nr:cell division protein ZapA [Candidatus Symbiothrix sp.]